jgi:hypothetical protein
MGEGRAVYRVLVGRLEENRPVRRSRRRWEIRIDGANWIRLARVADFCEHGDEHSCSKKKRNIF